MKGLLGFVELEAQDEDCHQVSRWTQKVALQKRTSIIQKKLIGGDLSPAQRLLTAVCLVLQTHTYYFFACHLLQEISFVDPEQVASVEFVCSLESVPVLQFHVLLPE